MNRKRKLTFFVITAVAFFLVPLAASDRKEETPAGMKPSGEYCLDTFDGTISGNEFHAQHTDHCTPATQVVFKQKKKC